MLVFEFQACKNLYKQAQFTVGYSDTLTSDALFIMFSIINKYTISCDCAEHYSAVAF